jgi:triosephosphate isomerase (TIM)
MQKIIVANWKMYGSKSMAETFLKIFLDSKTMGYSYIFCPPFTLLATFEQYLNNHQFKLGAQNCSAFDNGAFTGDVSANMLKEFNCSYCLVGHSERRQIFNENEEILAAKTQQLVKQDIIPIFCVGESLEDKRQGTTFQKIEHQLKAITQFENEIIIAYEPIWAIGTNEIPKVQEISEIHQFIKNLYPKPQKVLYGGSVNPQNASDILSSNLVDGILVGRASLEVPSLLALKES